MRRSAITMYKCDASVRVELTRQYYYCYHHHHHHHHHLTMPHPVVHSWRAHPLSSKWCITSYSSEHVSLTIGSLTLICSPILNRAHGNCCSWMELVGQYCRVSTARLLVSAAATAAAVATIALLIDSRELPPLSSQLTTTKQRW